MIEAHHIVSTLRDDPGFTRARTTNDIFKLLSIGTGRAQTRSVRRRRDILRNIVARVGEERLADELVRAQVIALMNVLVANEDLVTNPKPSKPYAAIHAAQAIMALQKALGLQDARSSAAPGSRLMEVMGEGGDG